VRLVRQNDKDFMEVILLHSFDRPKPTVGCSAIEEEYYLIHCTVGLKGGGALLKHQYLYSRLVGIAQLV